VEFGGNSANCMFGRFMESLLRFWRANLVSTFDQRRAAGGFTSFFLTISLFFIALSLSCFAICLPLSGGSLVFNVGTITFPVMVIIAFVIGLGAIAFTICLWRYFSRCQNVEPVATRKDIKDMQESIERKLEKTVRR